MINFISIFSRIPLPGQLFLIRQPFIIFVYRKFREDQEDGMFLKSFRECFFECDC